MRGVTMQKRTYTTTHAIDAMNEIGRWTRSVRNRIQSIIEDAEFVSAVVEAYGDIPLVPNKRCGLWYVPPAHRRAVAYFKSTDGHTGQWALSLKRLNLHLLPLISEASGIILVDSTRRGKRMPDAFSKTIPIWCAVLNRALGLGTSHGSDYEMLHLPTNVVSASERDQIAQLVPEWTRQLVDNAATLLEIHGSTLHKPLRPIWVVADGPLPLEPPDVANMGFYPVVVVTASRRAQDGELNAHGFAYVQGAADDHELWAGELTPELLWSHTELRENTSDEILRARISEAAAHFKGNEEIESHEEISVTPYFKVIYQQGSPNVPCIDLRGNSQQPTDSTVDAENGRWPIDHGKRGSRQLANVLTAICDYFETHKPHVIVCSPGADCGVCVAYVLDCIFFDDNGRLLETRKRHVPKQDASKRLVAIAAAAGGAPQRASLNAVGAFMRNSHR